MACGVVSRVTLRAEEGHGGGHLPEIDVAWRASRRWMVVEFCRGNGIPAALEPGQSRCWGETGQ